MNTPSPLIPQGALLHQQSKSHIRIAVFTILAIHIVLLGALLLQGCKRTTDTAGQQPSEPTNPFTLWQPPPLPPLETLTQQVVTLPPPPAISQPPGKEIPPPAFPMESPPIPEPPVPQPQPAGKKPPTAPVPSGTEHVVVKGDSFYLLAQKYGVAVKTIADANPNVDPRRLQIGQKIYIPAAGPVASLNQNAGAAANGQTRYAVKSGDTLTGIARDHKTTVAALRKANNLATDRIVVGQKLIIPQPSNP